MKGANREGLRAKIQRLITGGGADSQRPGTMTDSLVSSLQVRMDLPVAFGSCHCACLGRCSCAQPIRLLGHQVLKGSCSFEDFCAASRTLLTFVSNVLAHPGKGPC